MPIIVEEPRTGGYPRDAELSVLLDDFPLSSIDTDGVDFRIYDIDGWWDSADSTGEVSQRAGSDGGWLNEAHAGPRHYEVRITLVGPTYGAITAALGRVRAAMPLHALAPLIVAEDDAVVQTMVRQDGRLRVTRTDGPHFADLSIPLIAPDPLRYATFEQSASTGLPQTSGGMSLPLSLPLSIGATAASGRIATTNEGNAATPPTFEVAGPVPAGARVTLVSSGASLFIPNEVPAGRTLVLDAATQTALLDGTAPRLVTGVWFRIPPGEDDVAFTAPSFDPAARLTARWRSAYL